MLDCILCCCFKYLSNKLLNELNTGFHCVYRFLFKPNTCDLLRWWWWLNVSDENADFCCGVLTVCKHGVGCLSKQDLAKVLHESSPLVIAIKYISLKLGSPAQWWCFNNMTHVFHSERLWGPNSFLSICMWILPNAGSFFYWRSDK